MRAQATYWENYNIVGVLRTGMRCQTCGERIEDVFEAHAREACPHCDAPLNEKPAQPR